MNLSLAFASFISSLLVAAPSASACGVKAKSYGLKGAESMGPKGKAGKGSGGSEEAVYSMSNNPDNELVVYSVGAGGTLSFADRISTGGMGGGLDGGFLDATDPVIVAGRCVLNVNFGSNDISTYFINSATNLEFKGTFSSGGSGPVSLASTGRTVFALNAGGNGSIQGFQLNPRFCTLTPNGGAVELDQEVVPMAGFSPGFIAPSQIGITPDGKVNALIKITNGGGGVGTFNIYDIKDGAVDPESLQQIPVSGVNVASYAFEYLANGNVLVVDANGGTPFGEGHVSLKSSSGQVGPTPASGQLLLLDSNYEVVDAADSTQLGSCWMRYNPVTNIAYTANTPSGTISTFSVADDGVELVAAVAAAQAVNVDMLLCPDYKQLYVTSCNSSEGTSTLYVYDVTADATDGMELMQVVDPVPGIMCNLGLALYFPNGEDVEAEAA
eukprot:CAMPEP_0172545218 /NCGR_PEP_ID=MMETSP1067-20121228/15185_1 /TAXON_ID=265564 ORGANISM="Thalassiosira punctigera, Strain Tpunct2005C2" /NCGR_SAMPLE_ID=MMETSP1067 /ASSEMBLY_ACC=CAM_ASM_000444 /LENGTH=440 /DNA_ID=CAMNT_0013331921 /DNA_START=127 /DNA_END=1449 /DNA_ORIENTATION=+